MTATRVLTLSVTLAVAAALSGVSGFAAGVPASAIRLKTISSRVHGKGASLVIEATDPVPYVATRLDALTLLLDLRNVGAEGVSNRVPVSTIGPIGAVVLEVTDVMGTPTARLRVSLTQAVGHHVRSERNTIVVDFDKAANATAYPAPAPRQAPDAMQALAQSQANPADPLSALGVRSVAPGRVLPPGTAAFLARAAAPQATTPAGTVQEPKKWTGEPMNWNLEQADLLGTLRLIQEVSGLNMIIDPGVTGKVDLVLTQVPWDQTLDMVLKMNKLGYIVEDNIVRIAPLTVLADEHTQRRKLADEQALSGELVTMNKTLSYATANDMSPLLKSLLSSRGQIAIDPRTNTLIITDLQGRLDTITTLAGSLDRAQPQVEIEARIVQTTSTYAKALGIQWGFNGNVSPALGNTTGLAFPNNGSLGGRLGTQGPNGTSTAVNLPAGGATNSVGMNLGSINGAFNLDLALTALESDGHGKLLSTPKVTTLNNVEAEVAQGLQIPFQTTSNNTITTEFKDAALVLKVLPQITDAGTVIMRISVDKGSVGPTFAGVPSINTQRANTTVLVSDGETTVIGGIFEGDERKSTDSTPGLSRVPFLKWLFKRESMNEQNTELLIFITPRIIRK